MKNFIFLYYISTHTCHKSYFWKYYVVQGNTEAADQKCFIKAAVLKNVWKIHKKSHAQRFYGDRTVKVTCFYIDQHLL